MPSVYSLFIILDNKGGIKMFKGVFILAYTTRISNGFVNMYCPLNRSYIVPGSYTVQNELEYTEGTTITNVVTVNRSRKGNARVKRKQRYIKQYI